MDYQPFQFNTKLITLVYRTRYNAFPSQSSSQPYSIEEPYQLCQSDILLSSRQPTTVTSAYLTHYKAFPLQSSMWPCSIEQAYQTPTKLILHCDLDQPTQTLTIFCDLTLNLHENYVNSWCYPYTQSPP